MDIFFNELSLHDIKSYTQLSEFLKGHFDVLLKMKKSSGLIQNILPVYPEVEFLENIFPNFTSIAKTEILKYHKDANKLLFKLFTSKQLYKVSYPEYSVEGYENEPVGLGHAADNSLPSISLPSANFWKNNLVRLKKSFFHNNSEEISECSVEVRNVSLPEHIDNLGSDYIQINITNGLNLWNRKEEIFPNLIFCKSSQTKRFIKKTNAGSNLFDLINKLEQLQKAIELNDRSLKQISGAPRPETTTSHRRHEEYCPDGRTIEFSSHISILPHGTRLYFHPDFDNRKCYIGYIGPHL